MLVTITGGGKAVSGLRGYCGTATGFRADWLKIVKNQLGVSLTTTTHAFGAYGVVWQDGLVVNGDRSGLNIAVSQMTADETRKFPEARDALKELIQQQLGPASEGSTDCFIYLEAVPGEMQHESQFTV